MSDLITLIVEQNRQTHARLDELAQKFEVHVAADAAVHEIVRRHERYVGSTFRVLRWGAVTLVGAIMGYLGLK